MAHMACAHFLNNLVIRKYTSFGSLLKVIFYFSPIPKMHANRGEVFNEVKHNSGAQPEIFQGREGFVELGHFNKHFLKNKEKGSTGEHLVVFPPRYQGTPKSGHPCRFSKKAFRSPRSCTPAILTKSLTKHIRSNLRVGQPGRFVKNSVYPGKDTMVVKILDFRLFESLTRKLSRTFCSPKLSIGS